MDKQEIQQVRSLLQLMVRRFGFLQKEGAQCCGVSPVMSHILYEIEQHPGWTLNELADSLGLDNSTMSRHIQALSRQGLVLSLPSPEDRRYITLSLTPSGHNTAREINDQMTCYISDLFQQIPDAKRLQVLEAMEILVVAMQKSPVCCKAPL